MQEMQIIGQSTIMKKQIQKQDNILFKTQLNIKNKKVNVAVR